MRSDLFREEAISQRSGTQGLYGQPTGLAPPSWSRVTWLVGLFMVALAAFLLLVSHARTETVRGVLRYDSAEARLYVQSGGSIHAVFVQDGEEVVTGQPIAEIHNDRFLPTGGTLGAATLASLNLERNELVTQREAIEHSLEVALQLESQTQLDSNRRESTARSKLAILVARIEAAEKRRKDLVVLREKGLVAESLYSERVDAIAFLRQDFLEVEREISDALSSATRASTETQRLKSNAKRELSEIGQRIAQIDAQLQTVAADSVYIVRAPHTGRVTSLRARPGENADPDLPLAVIVPNDAELVAEFYVPSRAIGFIRTGQTVRLMYDAFPHQKFGVSGGKVAGVALIGQTAQELGLGTQSADPLYRISVSPDAATLSYRDQHLPLQTGMELSGEIILEERRLAEWLWEPLASFQRR